MANAFDGISVGNTIDGEPFRVTRDTIRDFAEASLDFNPLHFDDEYMEGSFGKTQFGGVIAHGMSTFALMTRTMTDWLLPKGGIHRRLETRWLNPTRPGDVVTPRAVVSQKVQTAKSRWVVFEVEVQNQRGEVVAKGESMAEFPENLQ